MGGGRVRRARIRERSDRISERSGVFAAWGGGGDGVNSAMRWGHGGIFSDVEVCWSS